MTQYLWTCVLYFTSLFLHVSKAQNVEDTSSVPLKISPNGRYITDQKGVPFLMVADVAWQLPRKVALVDLDLYLDTRKKQQFNTILIQALPPEPKAIMKSAPFQKGNNFAKPNAQYFDHLEKIVVVAKEKKLNIGIDLIPPGWYLEMQQQGVQACISYASYLSKRLSKYEHVFWLIPSIETVDPKLTAALSDGLRTPDSSKRIIASLSSQLKSSIVRPIQDSKTDMDFFIPDSTVSISQYLKYMDSQEESHFQAKRPFVISNVELTSDVKDQSLLFRNQIYRGVLNFSTGFCFSSTVKNSNPSWKQNMLHDGSEYVRHFVKIIGKLPWEFMRPNPDINLITSHAQDSEISSTFMNNHSLVLLYSSTSSSFTLNTATLGYSSYTIIWYSPRTGKRWVQHNIAAQPNYNISPPESQIGWDWVILIGGKK
jgi:hypothetical protein